VVGAVGVEFLALLKGMRHQGALVGLTFRVWSGLSVGRLFPDRRSAAGYLSDAQMVKR
jgi:hypothetical protein